MPKLSKLLRRGSAAKNAQTSSSSANNDAGAGSRASTILYDHEEHPPDQDGGGEEQEEGDGGRDSDGRRRFSLTQNHNHNHRLSHADQHPIPSSIATTTTTNASSHQAVVPAARQPPSIQDSGADDDKPSLELELALGSVSDLTSLSGFDTSFSRPHSAAFGLHPAPSASARKVTPKPVELDAGGFSPTVDYTIAEAQRRSSVGSVGPRDHPDEQHNPPSASKESSNSLSYLPRRSRPSARSLAATSIRSLNVVDEKAPVEPLPSLQPKVFPPPSNASLPSPRPSIAVRRQSLVPSSQQRLIKTLLDHPAQSAHSGDYFSRQSPSIQADMINRKIWVKRAGGSPTLVVATEEDLVDDLREVILRKYANSLGQTFDAPDIQLKLIPREPSSRQSNQERVLGPEEPVGRTLDIYYPGGQTVEEALIIDVLAQRRTPRPSPRGHASYRHPEDLRPGELGEYFPPIGVMSSPNAPGSIASSSGGQGSHHGPPQSMSVITTGQLPPLPSPGSRSSWGHRPKHIRQHTSSPTMMPPAPSSSINGMLSPS
jgi:hypothetical protein